jgi:16S rRNA processing protein RimM
LPDPGRLVALGIFGAPHGVRGQVRVKSYTEDPSAIGRYGALTDRARRRAFELGDVRVLKEDMLVVRVKHVASREAAERLNGVELFARREQLPPPSEDEFYHDDLVGLEAMTREGERLGTIVALRNFGAGDILEVAPAAGETFFLPFTKAVAVDIDFETGRMVIAPPEEIDGEDRKDD